MARCIDCARFPWVPGADYSMLPPMKCAKELEARRWTIESANIEHNCVYYEGSKAEKEAAKEAVKEAVKENDADIGTQDKVEEAAGRKNTRKRK